MSKRSKSLGRPDKGILPPVSAAEEKQAIRNRLSSLRDLSKSNANLPSTSTLHNGRLSLYMYSSNLGPRSLFSRRNTSYGRNEDDEMLNDVKEQLLDAKKKIAELNQKNKVLNTQLNRVTRESERREAHLQSIMVGRFQPAELNDTHLAVTLTSLEKKRFENEQIISAQARRIRQLEKFLNDEDIESDDDYPEGFAYENVEEEPTINGGVSRSKRKEVHDEKHKKKLELAKAHVEQNKELKAKLKQLSTQLSETKKKQPEGKGRVSTADVNRIINRLQENGLLKQQVDAATQGMQGELEEKTRKLEQLEIQYEKMKGNMEEERIKIASQLEDMKREQEMLDKERDKMQDEHNLRELQQEQLSGEITDLEGERRRISEERNEWTKMKTAYEKHQVAMEIEMRQMEDVIENLRRDNSTLRRRMSDLLKTTITDTKVQQKVLELENDFETSPNRPQNIPRLDMRNMSLEHSQSDVPSVNSLTSQLPDSPSTLWDPRLNYLSPAVVAHIIRQDATAVMTEEKGQT